jgi:hypothetical protein
VAPCGPDPPNSVQRGRRLHCSARQREKGKFFPKVRHGGNDHLHGTAQTSIIAAGPVSDGNKFGLCLEKLIGFSLRPRRPRRKSRGLKRAACKVVVHRPPEGTFCANVALYRGKQSRGIPSAWPTLPLGLTEGRDWQRVVRRPRYEDYFPMPWTSPTYDTNLGGYRANVTQDGLKARLSLARAKSGLGPIASRIGRSTITMMSRSGSTNWAASAYRTPPQGRSFCVML